MDRNVVKATRTERGLGSTIVLQDYIKKKYRKRGMKLLWALKDKHQATHMEGKREGALFEICDDDGVRGRFEEGMEKRRGK